MKNFVFALILLACVGTSTASQDSDFLIAREAFQSGNAKRLDESAARLKRHVLWPYVDYYQQRMLLRTTDTAAIRHFLLRYDGDHVADRLRSDWLKVLGKNQQWPLFEAEYPLLVNKDTELQCYYYQRQLDHKDISVLPDIRALWLTPTSLPDSCTPVFQSLIYGGQLTADDIWKRIRLALEEGQTGVATHVNRYLSGNETLNSADLNNAAKNPLRYLDTLNRAIRTRSDREIVLFFATAFITQRYQSSVYAMV
jgi:soluble lytic murein transglycosylase